MRRTHCLSVETENRLIRYMTPDGGGPAEFNPPAFADNNEGVKAFAEISENKSTDESTKLQTNERTQQADNDVGLQIGRIASLPEDMVMATEGALGQLDERFKEMQKNAAAVNDALAAENMAREMGRAPSSEQPPTADGREKLPRAAPSGTDARPEGAEQPPKTPEELRKSELLRRERGKLREADVQNWSTIDKGITDKKGNPFIYKKVQVEGQNVLVAYAPSGGLQKMDANTGKWSLVNARDGQLSEVGQGMAAKYKEITGPKAGEARKDIDERQAMVTRNTNNSDMEGFLKKENISREDFKADADYWEGSDNEEVRAKFETMFKNLEQKDGKKATPTPTERPKPDARTVVETPASTKPEDSREPAALAEAPEPAATTVVEKPATEATAKNVEAKEEAEAEKKTGQAVEEAQNTLENPNATPAERQLAIMTVVEAKLDEMEKENGPKKEEGGPETEAPTVVPEVPKTQKVEGLKKSDEKTQEKKDQEKRLMAEVRGGNPMQKVEDVIKTKQDTLTTSNKERDKGIDAAEPIIDAAKDRVQATEKSIADLRQELSGETADAKRTELNGKIATLEADLQTQQANVKTLEANRSILIKAKEEATAKVKSDIDTLRELDARTVKLADRTLKQVILLRQHFEDVGDKESLVSAAEGTNIESDGSLGFSVTLTSEAKETLDGIIPALPLKDKVGLKEQDDSPMAVLTVLQALKLAIPKREKK